MRRYERSSSDRKIAGVCGGLGNLMNADPTLVRLAFVFVGVLTGFAPLLVAYLVAWWIVPEESPSTDQAPAGPGGEAEDLRERPSG